MLPLPNTPLVLPAAADRTVPRLLRKVRMLALRALLLQSSAGLPSTLARPLRCLQRLLPPVLQRDGERLLQLIGAPDVLPGLLILQGGLLPSGEVLAEVGPHLLAALQGGGLLKESVLWEHPLRRLAAPALGYAERFAPPARALLADPSGLEVELADRSRHSLPRPAAPVYHPLLAGHPELQLATLDTNLISDQEAHPDKQGNALDLGGRPASQWAERLDAGLSIVAQALPEWHHDLPSSLVRVLPVGYEGERHLSASYREAPGLAWMSLHPSTLTLAEALVHECQHSRLNLASWLDPILHNAFSTWTESPVRPDLRPIFGVLLAVHAFVPVAALHARLAALDHPLAQGPDFARRRAQVLASNNRGLAVLQDAAQPSVLGRRLIDGLAELHRVLLALAPPAPSPLDSASLLPG